MRATLSGVIYKIPARVVRRGSSSTVPSYLREAGLQRVFVKIDALLQDCYHVPPLPEPWQKRHLPEEYVLSIMYFHLCYTMQSENSDGSGNAALAITRDLQRLLKDTASNAIKRSLQLSDYRHHMLKQMKGLALSSAVLDETLCYTYLEKTVQALRTFAMEESMPILTPYDADILDIFNFHPDNVMQYDLKLKARRG